MNFNNVQFKLKSLIFNNWVILITIFLVSECVVNPTGNFPLNDDWAYAKSVETLSNKHVFDIGWWPAMSLLTHTLWGFIFIKIFGFSFFVLRLSILCLSLITILYVEKFIYQLVQSKLTALLGALCLFFNPLFFNLSNSYMTDVSFLSFFFFSIYHYHQFFLHAKRISLIWLTFFALATIFVRQLGLIIPLSLLVVNGVRFFLSKEKYLEFIFAIVLCGICFLTLYIFERHYVPKLIDKAPYQGIFFSKTKSKISLDFKNLFMTFVYVTTVFYYYSGLFLFPILGFSALRIIKNFIRSKLIITVPLFLFFLFFLSKTHFWYPIGNLIYNCGLGVELTFDVFLLKINENHAEVNAFTSILKLISIIGSLLFTLFLLSRLNSNLKITKEILLRHHFSIWIIILFLSYSFLISVSYGFFDRYSLLPALLICIFFFKYINIKIHVLNSLFVAIFAYFSIFATKDYFNFHKANQDLANYLKIEKNIKPENINAGFEDFLWNLYDSTSIKKFESKSQEYCISFGDAPNYHKIKEFNYQRYFPYRNEKLYILKKD
jgi:hypothetical protein